MPIFNMYIIIRDVEDQGGMENYDANDLIICLSITELLGNI